MTNAARHKNDESPLLHPDDRWMNFTEVCRRRGHSRMTGWRQKKEGIFPKPNGRDAKGRDMWLQSNVDNDLRNNLED